MTMKNFLDSFISLLNSRFNEFNIFVCTFNINKQDSIQDLSLQNTFTNERILIHYILSINVHPQHVIKHKHLIKHIPRQCVLYTM